MPISRGIVGQLNALLADSGRVVTKTRHKNDEYRLLDIKTGKSRVISGRVVERMWKQIGKR
jgi:hypothetical protein